MITPEKLQEWKSLCEKATPGPWSAEKTSTADRRYDLHDLILQRDRLKERVAKLRKAIASGDKTIALLALALDDEMQHTSVPGMGPSLQEGEKK